jgi:hypothetical protein
MERGHHQTLLAIGNPELDEVGNTEMLPWMILFGTIGNIPGELISYQPTWHHGHAVMRFLPYSGKIGPSKEGLSAPATYQFKNSGTYEFYKHPAASAYQLNKLLYDLRHKQQLRYRFLTSTKEVTDEYGLPPVEADAVEKIKDENIDVLRSLKDHPLVTVGAHPLGMLMCMVVVQAEARRLRAAAKN